MTRDLLLVKDVEMTIQEMTALKVSPWDRSLIPRTHDLTSILIACDGSTMSTAAMVYFLFSSSAKNASVSNLAANSSIISKFSHPWSRIGHRFNQDNQ